MSNPVSRDLAPLEQSTAQWFARELQPHEPELRAFLHRHFPAAQDIDDLVQEAFARLIRARQTRVIDEPRAYLFRTARNLAVDLFRRHPTVSYEALVETDRLSVVEDGPDAAEIASHAQEIELLTEAIHALPARCREVVTLRRLHGLGYREIALRLGISENTVNSQLAIGIARCRRYLEARGVTKEGC